MTKTINVPCDYCKKEFPLIKKNIKRSKYHYCCKEHADLDKIKMVECICGYCGEKFKKTACNFRRSKSGLYFCCIEHKNLATRVTNGIIKPSHYKGGVTVYRKIAFDFYEHKCESCNWSLYEDLLEVHHIDMNRQNNKIENLIILCPTCHRGLTLKKAILTKERQWVYTG